MFVLNWFLFFKDEFYFFYPFIGQISQFNDTFKDVLKHKGTIIFFINIADDL